MCFLYGCGAPPVPVIKGRPDSSYVNLFVTFSPISGAFPTFSVSILQAVVNNISRKIVVFSSFLKNS